jgi:hypothetical protein
MVDFPIYYTIVSDLRHTVGTEAEETAQPPRLTLTLGSAHEYYGSQSRDGHVVSFKEILWHLLVGSEQEDETWRG